jgi:hypothetical protein
MSGQSLVWKCYNIFFHRHLQSGCVATASALVAGLLLAAFLSRACLVSPEIIVLCVYKVVAAFPAYTAWAGDRMLSQAYNSIWELFR